MYYAEEMDQLEIKKHLLCHCKRSECVKRSHQTSKQSKAQCNIYNNTTRVNGKIKLEKKYKDRDNTKQALLSQFHAAS